MTLSVPHSSGDYQVYDIHPKGQGYLVTTVSASPQAGAISSPDPVGTLVIAKGWVKGLR